MNIQHLLATADRNAEVGDKARKLPESRLPQALYMCPVCRETYDTLAEALTCAEQPLDTRGLSVGDLVIIPGMRRSPASMDAIQDHWIACKQGAAWESADHFDKYVAVYPWYVVTAIHTGHNYREQHRVIVTVATLVNSSLWYGWNPAKGAGHHMMYKPNTLPADQLSNFEYSGKQNNWWLEHEQAGTVLGDLIFNAKPSERLLAEAAELAATGLSTTVLL